MSAPPVPVSGNQGDGGRPRQSPIYKLVVTPVVFISFVISLALVDFRHSVSRSHYHADPGHSRLPRWLHRLVYRYQRYQYVPVDENGRRLAQPETTDQHSYYHSKQRKLMKMAADEAFEIRNIVLAATALVTACIICALWRVLCWVLSVVGLTA
ncbi:hypothetical protein B0H67DRAFT_36421 [Lasiosphaeris hirsuta]|uniref:Uncharacterized protein n=1 Tax=Lasiosphaeris hirsuta TaxID=260670 RepID=A0AA40BAB7_9PEZI|nr:hypothetical protein B0H67DRAFT_36421 [Lasiosphaeris hirsuta]